jgi:hypothetical protein
MKKAIIIIIFALVLFAGSSAGYLYYDWHSKMDIGDEDRYIYMYSWTDKQGQIHLSDNKPSEDAQNIKTIQGLKQLEKPAIVRIQESFSELLHSNSESFAAKTEPKQENRQSLGSSSVSNKRNPVTATRRIERKKFSRKIKGKT